MFCSCFTEFSEDFLRVLQAKRESDWLFGYIKPYTPELKMKEYEAFRAVYCGLCHQLKQSFGVLSTVTLNYDFVFLAMLYYAQQEEPPKIIKGRCAVNPFQKVPRCLSDKGMMFSADVAAIMMYYKVQDNVMDSGFVKSFFWKVLGKIMGGKYKKAAIREPFADEILSRMMTKQQLVEKEKSGSLDAACEPTAWALSSLAGHLVLDASPHKEGVCRLGYLVGRYIYLCDAVEDLEKDILSDNYNPLIYRYLANIPHPTEVEIRFAQQAGVESLYMTVGEMGNLAEQVEFAYFAPILHNIIQDGMRHSANELYPKKGDNPNEKSL